MIFYIFIFIINEIYADCHVIVPKPPRILEHLFYKFKPTTLTPTSTAPIITSTLVPASTSTFAPTLTSMPVSITTFMPVSITTPASVPITTFTLFSTPVPITTSAPTPTPTPTFTSNVVSTPVSIENRQMILNMHNTERLLVNTTNLLKWSDALERSARELSINLANIGCALRHRLGSGVRGQNLYGTYGRVVPNYNNAVNAWILEKNLLDKPNVTFSEIGHYLIMVSSQYNNVGCSAGVNLVDRCYVIACDYN